LFLPFRSGGRFSGASAEPIRSTTFQGPGLDLCYLRNWGFPFRVFGYSGSSQELPCSLAGGHSWRSQHSAVSALFSHQNGGGAVKLLFTNLLMFVPKTRISRPVRREPVASFIWMTVSCLSVEIVTQRSILCNDGEFSLMAATVRTLKCRLSLDHNSQWSWTQCSTFAGCKLEKKSLSARRSLKEVRTNDYRYPDLSQQPLSPMPFVLTVAALCITRRGASPRTRRFFTPTKWPSITKNWTIVTDWYCTLLEWIGLRTKPLRTL